MDPKFDERTHFLLPAGDGRTVPIVFEHATGKPCWAVVDGKHVPYDEWVKTLPPREPVPAQSFAIQAQDATFRGTLEVT